MRIALAFACAVAVAPAEAGVFLSQAEALQVAFPAGTTIERQTAYLTEAQLREARSLAGPEVEIESALVTRYVGRDDSGAIVATAYFDSHRVRTLRETIMIVVEPAGTARRVDVLAFDEPPEYMPKKGWLEQLLGRPLDGDLSLKRGIRPITGASLSSQAATDAVRRVLAIHRVIP